MSLEYLTELHSRVGSCGNLAIVAGQPDFANGLLLRSAVIPRVKILPPPHTSDKLRLNSKWSHSGKHRSFNRTQACPFREQILLDAQRAGKFPGPIRIASCGFYRTCRSIRPDATADRQPTNTFHGRFANWRQSSKEGVRFFAAGISCLLTLVVPCPAN